jgi:multidrug efflux pump subunit AcrB
MRTVAARNESFNETLAAADTDDDGVPDENVTAVYDELFRVAPEEAADVVHRADGEYRAVRLVVTVDSSVSDDTVSEQMGWIADDVDRDGVSTIATGDTIVNRITADQLAETALLSLIVALLSVLVVLAVAYRLTEGSASLGVVTILPVALTLTWVLGTMALLDIPFNIVTGMITGLTIGLGVDYSLHVSERFNQELDDVETTVALRETVTGTGGALLSSATTTASGFAVLLVAVLPFLQSFGLITALTIVYALVASVFVLPSLLAVWARLVDRGETPETADRSEATEDSPEATRTIHRQYPIADQSVRVTISLRGRRRRLSLRETCPGEITAIEATPEPVTVTRNDGGVTVCWNTEEPLSEVTLEYTMAVPADVTDGDVLTFEGHREDADGHQPIGGDVAATVVGDVFQRVLERGAVTDADLQLAVERDDVTPVEVDRLRRGWLEEN